MVCVAGYLLSCERAPPPWKGCWRDENQPLAFDKRSFSASNIIVFNNMKEELKSSSSLLII